MMREINRVRAELERHYWRASRAHSVAAQRSAEGILGVLQACEDVQLDHRLNGWISADRVVKILEAALLPVEPPRED